MSDAQLQEDGALSVPPILYGNMETSAAQEWLSRAYIQAVASAAKCTFADHRPDTFGIDLSIQHEIIEDGEVFPAGLEVQARSSGQDIVGDEHVALSIERALYDRLRSTNATVPRILVVVAVPAEFEEWIHQTEEHMLLRKCAYWRSLYEQPPTENKSTTIHFPRANVFDVRALCDLMRRVREGVPLEGGEEQA